jgi:hypothetical protein
MHTRKHANLQTLQTCSRRFEGPESLQTSQIFRPALQGVSPARSAGKKTLPLASARTRRHRVTSCQKLPHIAGKFLGRRRPHARRSAAEPRQVSLENRAITRATVRATGAGFESDARQTYADIPVMSVTRSPFDVTAEGPVLVLERTVSQGVPLVGVINWMTELAR